MSEKVLIIEDDALTAELLRRILELDGIESLVADPQAAISTIEAERPSLAIIDFHLMGVGGLELLEHIRAKPPIAATPVLMMSALDKYDQCLQAGANAFLLKPFNRDQLYQAMEEARQSAREYSEREVERVKQQK